MIHLSNCLFSGYLIQKTGSTNWGFLNPYHHPLKRGLRRFPVFAVTLREVIFKHGTRDGIKRFSRDKLIVNLLSFRDCLQANLIMECCWNHLNDWVNRSEISPEVEKRHVQLLINMCTLYHFWITEWDFRNENIRHARKSQTGYQLRERDAIGKVQHHSKIELSLCITPIMYEKAPFC